ncbi:MAG: ATP-grasp domain-containing protein [Oscillospiraceae bacterium]|nr:ATP-grasp domain-containing protein [Oscillospiraceae bacterium]
MTAIVTDVKYRMSVALLRDLIAMGVRVIACERATSGTPPLGFAVSGIAETHVLPDDDYAGALLRLCRETAQRDGAHPALLPVGRDTMLLLARPEQRDAFAPHCGLLLSDEETLARLNDKTAVAALARNLSIPVPEAWTRADGESTADFTRRVPCPVVVKPSCGEALGLHAAERYAICRDAEALYERFAHFQALDRQDPIVQTWLPGAGMGCSVLAQEGGVISSLSHIRVREYPISGGPSSCCRAIHSATLEAWTAALSQESRLNGLMMAEYKCDANGTPHLLEINPRVWGSFPLTRISGSALGRNWFRLAWNLGNPDQPPLPLEHGAYRESTMCFFPTDLLAGLGYLRRHSGGDFRRALGAVGCFFSPSVKDGLWEWGDRQPAITYYKSLIRRGSQNEN